MPTNSKLCVQYIYPNNLNTQKERTEEDIQIEEDKIKDTFGKYRGILSSFS